MAKTLSLGLYRELPAARAGQTDHRDAFCLRMHTAPSAPYIQKRRQQTVSTCVDCSVVRLYCLVQTFIVLCWLVSIAPDARHKWLTNSQRSILAQAAVADTQAICRCINPAFRLAAAAAACCPPSLNSWTIRRWTARKTGNASSVHKYDDNNATMTV